MVAAKLQLLIALGVALNVAHAGPIDYSNSKVHMSFNPTVVPSVH